MQKCNNAQKRRPNLYGAIFWNSFVCESGGFIANIYDEWTFFAETIPREVRARHWSFAYYTRPECLDLQIYNLLRGPPPALFNNKSGRVVLSVRKNKIKNPQLLKTAPETGRFEGRTAPTSPPIPPFPDSNPVCFGSKPHHFQGHPTFYFISALGYCRLTFNNCRWRFDVSVLLMG